MEKSRAIELLEHLAWDRDIDRNPYGDALNIAIDALKAQLSQEGTTSDTISRQEALEKVRIMQAYKLFEGDDMILIDKAKVQTELMMLPSVQPETPCYLGSPCEYQNPDVVISQPVATDTNVGDTISRQQAIDALDCINGVEEVLRSLPSVQPEVLACGNGELVAKPEPHWILVSERLPRDGSWNIFTDGKNISVERYKADAIDHFFPNGRWFGLEDAIAWMPLPEPYQKGASPC